MPQHKVQARMIFLLDERKIPNRIVVNHDPSVEWMIGYTASDNDHLDFERFITNRTLISDLWWLV